MYYLGIDIGTSSICGVVYDIAKNKIESINKDNDSDIKHLIRGKKFKTLLEFYLL